jgi:acetyl esterase/lipase
VHRISVVSADFYPKSMKIRSIAAIGSTFAVLLAVTGTAAEATGASTRSTVQAASGRGQLLSVTAVANLDRTQVAATLADVPFEGAHPRYAVRAYRIEYRTIDMHSAPTTASALVALPVHRPGRASTVAWEHGTRVGRSDVASMSADNLDRPTAILFASAGFVTVAPDYLGLGTGPGAHPYTHAATEASASLDAVRAGRTLASLRGQRLSDDVLVSGFSQGGQAAMALAPVLDQAPGLRLRAVAGISGSYDLSGTEIPALWDGRVDPAIGAFYLAYWTLSSNATYGLFSSPAEVFQAPYDQTLPPLFDGDHDESAIFPALAPSPEQLVTPQYAARLRHPQGALLRAIQENSRTCQWRAPVPVRLYAASGDREVPIGNTEQCARQLRAAGTGPTVKNLGDVEHMSTPVIALPDVAHWFTSIAG